MLAKIARLLGTLSLKLPYFIPLHVTVANNETLYKMDWHNKAGAREREGG